MFSKKLEYRSLPNIRDLGGMRTKDGRQIAPGKLIRCGHLSGLSGRELSDLADLVGVVIDFRSDGERSENPDAQIADAIYYHNPVVESLTPGVSREASADRHAIEQLLFGADEDFINAYYDAVAERYGGMDGMFSKGLGLSDRDIEKFQKMYLC